MWSAIINVHQGCYICLQLLHGERRCIRDIAQCVSLPTEQDEFSRQDKLQTPSVTQQQKGSGLKMAVGGVPSHRDQWIFCVSNRGGQELTPANLMTAAVGSGPSRRYYSVRSQVDDGRERDANTDMGAEFLYR